MTLATLIFLTICAVTLAGGMVCLVARSLIHAALGLGAAMVGVAGLYLSLQADYLAAIQLIVYVGGVLVLILFGVMFSKDLQGKTQRPLVPTFVLGGLVTALVLVSALRLVGGVFTHASTQAVPLATLRSDPLTQPAAISGPFGTTLGDALLGPYLLPFMLVAVLLTVVLVGAVATVRRNIAGSDDA